MFASTSTRGLPLRRAAAGSATDGDERIASGRGRPSSDLPNDVTTTFGLASAIAASTRSTSAARLVSSKFVASARVFWASGTSAACTIALARNISRNRALRIRRGVYRTGLWALVFGLWALGFGL